MRLRSGWTCPVSWPLLILMQDVGLIRGEHSDTPHSQTWSMTCTMYANSFVSPFLLQSQCHIGIVRHVCLILKKSNSTQYTHPFTHRTCYNEFLSHSKSRSCSSHRSFLPLFIRESGLCKRGTIETGMKWGEANEWMPPSTVTYSSTLCGEEPSLTIEGFLGSALHFIVFPGSGNILFDC